MGQQPTQTLIPAYYTNLITSEYRLSVNFNLWLEALLQIADDLSQLLVSITPLFDIDFAFGAQLDVLGAQMGIPRTVPFQPSNGVSPVLDDESYRLLIRATSFNNRWDGTLDSLYAFWPQLFGSGAGVGRIVIMDNQDMTAEVIVTGAFPSIVQDMILNDMIVPRPQGVKYNYFLGNIPFFGFGVNNEYIAGFGKGYWG
jgi:hypothetical protein